MTRGLKVASHKNCVEQVNEFLNTSGFILANKLIGQDDRPDEPIHPLKNQDAVDSFGNMEWNSDKTAMVS